MPVPDLQVDPLVRATPDPTRRCLIVTLATLLVATLLPAPAASAMEPADLPALFELRAGQALARLGEDAPRDLSTAERVDAAFDDEGRLNDPGPFLELAVARMREAFGPQSVPLGHGDAVVASHQSGVFRIGLPAGDLDGDGAVESLVYALDIRTFVLSFVAVDGDGTELWARTVDLAAEDYYDLIPIFPGDLDGDGADDVLLYSLRILAGDGGFTCVPFAVCGGSGAIQAEWRLEAVHGADGTTLADVRYPAFATFVEAFDIAPTPTFTYVATAKVDNALVYPVPAGDLDGDGGVDLVVIQDDVEITFAYGFAGILVGAFIFVADVSVDSEATAVRGADGTSLGAFAVAEDAPADPYVLPLGDASGDGVADLLVLTSEGDGTTAFVCAFALIVVPCADVPTHYSTTLSARSATDGTTHWSQGGGAGWALVVAGDADGDGTDDIATAGDGGVTLRSGATGAASWTRSDLAPDLLFAPGDLDGDGRDDVMYGEYDFWESRVTFTALSGADGSTLYTVTLDDTYDALALAGGDQDGDGGADLLVVAIGPDGWSLRVVSGADATTLWAETHDGGAWIEAAGDVDGDGDDDAVTTTPSDIAYGTSWAFSTRDEAGGVIATDTEEVLFDSDAVAFGAGGSFGDGTADVLTTAIQAAGATLRSTVGGVDGATGMTLFAVGDDLLGPGDVDLPVQDDAGSGGDASDSRFDAVPIVPGAYTGGLYPEYDDRRDWFAFDAFAGDDVLVEMAPPAGSDFDLRVCHAQGGDANFTTCRVSFSDGDALESIAFAASVSGTHWIGVSHFSGPGGNYSLTLVVAGDGGGGDDGGAPSFSKLDRERTVPGRTLRALDIQGIEDLDAVRVDGVAVAYTVETKVIPGVGTRRDVAFVVPELAPGLHEVRLENVTGEGQSAPFEIAAPTDLAVTAVAARLQHAAAGDVVVPTGNLRVDFTIANLGDATNFNPDSHPDLIWVSITATPKDGPLSDLREPQTFHVPRLAAIAPGGTLDVSFEVEPRLRFVGEYDLSVSIAYNGDDLDASNDSASTSFHTYVKGAGGV